MVGKTLTLTVHLAHNPISLSHLCLHHCPHREREGFLSQLGWLIDISSVAINRFQRAFCYASEAIIESESLNIGFKFQPCIGLRWRLVLTYSIVFFVSNEGAYTKGIIGQCIGESNWMSLQVLCSFLELWRQEPQRPGTL